MIPASFLSYTNLNGLHSNMKLFCPGDGDGLLAAAPHYTQSGPDKSFRNMIPPYVCSCAVRGSWSFYGNQVLSWMKTRGKQTKMTKWGVMLDSIQAQLWYYPNQSRFRLAKFECEGRSVATAGMLDAPPYPWCI